MNSPNNTSKTIEIIIDAQGQSLVQTKGFSGPSCRDASKFIEQALGERLAEKLTAEFYQEQTSELRVGQG